jgi:hypothetical protein
MVLLFKCRGVHGTRRGDGSVTSGLGRNAGAKIDAGQADRRRYEDDDRSRHLRGNTAGDLEYVCRVHEGRSCP